MAFDKDEERSGSLFFLICHYIYSIFLFIAGLGCVGVGLWMAIDPDVKAYFVVFRRDPGDDLLVAGVACFIVTGLLLCGVGALGCFGAMTGRTPLLMLYVGVLVIVFIIEATIGFCVVTFREDVHESVKNSMKEQIQTEYTWDNTVGKSWNRVQVRSRCCGADGSWDYESSNWFWGENPGISEVDQAQTFVPDSCCVLEYNQDRDPDKVDPQETTPKDRRRCNEDAAGRKNDNNYLHGRGCYAAMLDYIYIHINLVMGLSLAAGLMQIFGVVVAIFLIKSYRQPSY